MKEGEKRIRLEDCSEDRLGPGVLVLTNERIAFDKTKGRIIDFKKEFGETIIDVPLEAVTKVWKEGLLMKKVCFTANIDGAEETYKFGVLGSGSWRDSIQDAMRDI